MYSKTLNAPHRPESSSAGSAAYSMIVPTARRSGKAKCSSSTIQPRSSRDDERNRSISSATSSTGSLSRRTHDYRAPLRDSIGLGGEQVKRRPPLLANAESPALTGRLTAPTAGTTGRESDARRQRGAASHRGRL